MEGTYQSLHIVTVMSPTSKFWDPQKRRTLSMTQKDLQVECGFRGSNTRPLDLQSNALPTELKPLQRPDTMRHFLEYITYIIWLAT